MSLINEALKKARHDAEQAVPRASPAPAPSHLPGRRLPIGLFAAGLAVIAAVIATWLGWPLVTSLASRGRSERDSRPAASAPDNRPTAPTPVASDAVSAPATKPASTPVAEQLPDQGEEGGAPTAEPADGPAPPRVATETESAPRPVEPPLEQTDAAEEPAKGGGAARRRRAQREGAPSASDESALDGASFLKRAPLPEGGSLVLSGIAWSETQPVAVISGSIVGPGERVNGYKVVRITPDTVELEGRRDERFTLRLR